MQAWMMQGSSLPGFGLITHIPETQNTKETSRLSRMEIKLTTFNAKTWDVRTMSDLTTLAQITRKNATVLPRNPRNFKNTL